MKALLAPTLVAITLLSPLSAFAANSEQHRHSFIYEFFANLRAHNAEHWQRVKQENVSQDRIQQVDVPSTSVPEPGALALLAAGMVGVYVVRRRQK